MDSILRNLIAVIRINPAYLSDMDDDIKRFNYGGIYGIKYEVPLIRELGFRPGSQSKVELIDKPLLINYGFLRMPWNFAKNYNRLQQIRSLTRFIRGFFFKTPDELKEEAEANEGCLIPFRPLLIKGISENELEALYKTADSIRVNDAGDQVKEGDYIILRGYPFEGMGAMVLERFPSGKLQVELLSSNLIAMVSPENVFYTRDSVYNYDL